MALLILKTLGGFPCLLAEPSLIAWLGFSLLVDGEMEGEVGVDDGERWFGDVIQGRVVSCRNAAKCWD